MSNDKMTKLAERYYELGWSLVPIAPNSKKPIIGWQRFQNERMGLNELADFIAKDAGIGIVLGKISGNLVVRDFDNAEAYNAWRASFEVLAQVLPTVQTHRGFHVYCRVEDPGGTKKFSDGELRGNGSIIVAPPTPHPISKLPYRWFMEPSALMPVLPLADTGLKRHWHSGRPLEGSDKVNSSCSPPEHRWWLEKTIEAPLTSEQNEQIENAIRQTVPFGVGTRNDGIFRFARRILLILSGIPEPKLARAIAIQWFHAARPYIGTLDPAVTTADFLRALENVKKLEVQSPVGIALEMAAELPVPAFVQFAADIDPSAKSILLAKLVVAMDQLHSGGIWFLSSHYAAEHLDMKPSSVYSLLLAWVRSKVLMLVERGASGRGGGKANRYRLINDQAGLA